MTEAIEAAVRVSPQSVEELAQVMRAAQVAGSAIAFLGGGTALDQGYPAERVDAVFSTERLTNVLEHAAEDMTVTVHAGITLAALQRVLKDRKQRLALDAPLAERATIGGLIATNGSGPGRTRYGTLRDLVLGASFVRADGTLVRGGGKVVKNVAGFDVPKLLIGSLGSLGCIATVTLRLHPLPERAASVALACPSSDALWAFCNEIVDAQLEPSAVVAILAEEGYEVRVLFEGFVAGVDEQCATCLERARGLKLTCGVEPAGTTAQFWTEHERIRTEGDVRFRMTFPPASLSEVAASTHDEIARALTDASMVMYPTVGVSFWSGSPGDLDATVNAMTAARVVAESRGGALVVLAAPPALRERFDIYGSLPPAFPLMRNIKERFDPERLCNRGRFIGHL